LAQTGMFAFEDPKSHPNPHHSLVHTRWSVCGAADFTGAFCNESHHLGPSGEGGSKGRFVLGDPMG